MRKRSKWDKISAFANTVIAVTAVVGIFFSLLAFRTANNTNDISDKSTDISARLLKLEEDSRYANLRIYLPLAERGEIPAIRQTAFISPLGNKDEQRYLLYLAIINIGGADTGAVTLILKNNWTEDSTAYIGNIPARNTSYVQMYVNLKEVNLEDPSYLHVEDPSKVSQILNFSKILSTIPLGEQNLTIEIRPCYLCNEESKKIDVSVCIYEDETIRKARCPNSFD